MSASPLPLSPLPPPRYLLVFGAGGSGKTSVLHLLDIHPQETINNQRVAWVPQGHPIMGALGFGVRDRLIAVEFSYIFRNVPLGFDLTWNPPPVFLFVKEAIPLQMPELELFANVLAMYPDARISLCLTKCELDTEMDHWFLENAQTLQRQLLGYSFVDSVSICSLPHMARVAAPVRSFVEHRRLQSQGKLVELLKRQFSWVAAVKPEAKPVVEGKGVEIKLDGWKAKLVGATATSMVRIAEEPREKPLATPQEDEEEESKDFLSSYCVIS